MVACENVDCLVEWFHYGWWVIHAVLYINNFYSLYFILFFSLVGICISVGLKEEVMRYFLNILLTSFIRVSSHS